MVRSPADLYVIRKYLLLFVNVLSQYLSLIIVAPGVRHSGIAMIHTCVSDAARNNTLASTDGKRLPYFNKT